MRSQDARFRDADGSPQDIARRLLRIVENDGFVVIENGLVKWMADATVPLRALLTEDDLVRLIDVASQGEPCERCPDAVVACGDCRTTASLETEKRDAP